MFFWFKFAFINIDNIGHYLECIKAYTYGEDYILYGKAMMEEVIDVLGAEGPVLEENQPPEGRITVEAFKSVLTDKTKVVAITYVSNVMGYITPKVKGKADLSKINGEKNLVITQSIHKATIELTQYGIKAAAVTMMGGAGNASACPFYIEKDKLPIEEIDMNFNKPFLYIIRDKDSGEVWFTGSVYIKRMLSILFLLIYKGFYAIISG